MRLTVARGDGASPAPDELTAELACSQAPATQAGRVYLDGQAGLDRIEVDLSARPETAAGVRLPGQVAAVADPDGAAWNGYVTAFSLTLAVDADTGAASLDHQYTLERPQP